MQSYSEAITNLLVSNCSIHYNIIILQTNLSHFAEKGYKTIKIWNCWQHFVQKIIISNQYCQNYCNHPTRSIQKMNFAFVNYGKRWNTLDVLVLFEIFCQIKRCSSYTTKAFYRFDALMTNIYKMHRIQMYKLKSKSYKHQNC